MSINPLIDSILCLGDSITEMGWQEGGLTQQLSVRYFRKLDVVNRGLGGYNTDWYLPIAEKIIGEAHRDGRSNIAFVTIWFGANDAVLDGMPSGQHVPIDRYKKNLLAMYSLYPSSIPTIFITAPPIQPKQWRDRDLRVTYQYGEAVKDLAKEVGASVVDAYKEFDGKDLDDLLSDGLHLKPAGYDIILNAILKIIRNEYRHLAPENLPLALPSWEDHVCKD